MSLHESSEVRRAITAVLAPEAGSFIKAELSRFQLSGPTTAGFVEGGEKKVYKEADDPRLGTRDRHFLAIRGGGRAFSRGPGATLDHLGLG